MKKNVYIFSILFLFSGIVLAQSGQKTIVEELNTYRSGQGSVKVMQDETIQQIIAVHKEGAEAERTSTDQPQNVSRTRGFRIQVFSGNNPRQSRREAESKQAQIRSAFPELDTQVSFESPFWRLRAGNFSTREEAEEMLIEMKKRFPSFGREMYIISPSR